MSNATSALPKLSVRGLTHQFRPMATRAPLTVLQDVDLTIPRGAFVSIIGQSGCGKSTLLRLMAGLLSPTQGEILHDDQTVRGLDRRLGFVFQQDAVFPWLTVARNVEYGPRCRGVPRAERERLVEQWCAAVGLEAFRDAYPKELSGGMRKRVDLARVYANAPDVLFMDEPFGALDVQTKATMQQTVLDLWHRTGTTIAFVTHDLEEAVFLSDVVIVLSARPGRVFATIPIDVPRPRNAETRLGDAFAAAKRLVWSAMQGAQDPKAAPPPVPHSNEAFAHGKP
jgi:NitT/TauT family transport system ATP-binding protein